MFGSFMDLSDVGAAIGNGFITGDYSKVGQAIARPFMDMLQTSLQGAGPFGSLLGGIAGSLLQGLFSGDGGIFGSGKSAPGQTGFKAYVTNWPEQLTAGIELLSQQFLRSSNIVNLNAGNASPRNIARSMQAELQTS